MFFFVFVCSLLPCSSPQEYRNETSMAVGIVILTNFPVACCLGCGTLATFSIGNLISFFNAELRYAHVELFVSCFLV